MNSSISYTQVSEIASRLSSSAAEMTTLLDSVKTQLNRVGDDGTWAGTAASSVKAELDELIGKFPQFYEAVQSCSDYLTKVVIPNFQAVDQAIRGQQ